MSMTSSPRTPRQMPRFTQPRMQLRIRSHVPLHMLVVGAVAVAITACGGGDRNTDMRQWTNDMAFRISSTPLPPVAEDITTFKIVVQDKESGQPIETGEGRIFATSPDRAQAGDGLAKGKEVGTYYARVRFPVSGEWSMGLQFRRDSTKPLERTQDWQQMVLRPPPVGSDTTKR